jgi:hypothetical protein
VSGCGLIVEIARTAKLMLRDGFPYRIEEVPWRDRS